MSEPDKTETKDSLTSRALNRVLDSASSMLARSRLRDLRTELQGLATPTLRPTALRDRLLIEAQQATYRQLHQRFTERASRGETGLDNALDALDAMWTNVRRLRAGAPSIMKTLSSPHSDVQSRLENFYRESTELLEDAIRHVFREDLGQLAVPPDRMAVLVRVLLEGLVVELAQARTAEDVGAVDQAYADLRGLFERFVLLGDSGPAVDPVELEPIPLPW